MRWAGQVERTGKRRGVYRILVGKPEGKRPLARPSRWEDNNTMDIQEVVRAMIGFIWPRTGTGDGHM